MTNIKKILSLARQNKGYIANKKVQAMGLSTKYLSDLVKSKKIEKIKPGLYLHEGSIPDDFFETLYNTSGTFSHTTALYFHNLTDRTPIKLDITVANDYKGSLQNNKKVNLFYINKNLYSLGQTEIKSPQGLPIKVYDIERTICDIIKSEKKIETEIFVSSLQKYARDKNKKLNILLKYASLFGISTKVEDKLRILL
ncbi:MAG: type IV toxin-antitoxin system AbiEi family antitoxin domain-containing protein [Endomicrobiaceae bacterium]|nr:type IV toxin-antitoxin system AbiEi family antitoxin domain-containing protein [Endomicrobiaceae bacterium]